MDVNRLNREELVFEMTVRGVRNIQALTVEQMRKKLRDDMRNETLGELITDDDYNPDIASEITICNNKIVHLDAYVNSKDILRNSNEHKYLNTKLQHVYSRLARLKPTVEEVGLKNSIKNLQSQLGEIEQTLDDKLLAGEGVSRADNAVSVEISSHSQSGSNSNRCYVPVHKWGVYFSGDPNDKNGLSVNAFIERVEEFRLSRGVSEEELKNSITDLLKGGALIWHRLVKNDIRSWSHFIELLKEEYLPFTFEKDLKEEIRNSVQDSRERVGSYFARMLNLFSRLSNPVSETEKLETLRQNVDPYYIHGLGSNLYNIDCVDNLLSECKKLEKTRNLAASRPTTKRLHFIEKDLAGPSSSGSTQTKDRVENLNSVVCWNCNETGHNFSKCRKRREQKFCFRCGKRDVTKYTCSCNRGNGGRDRQVTGQRSQCQNR